MRKHFLLVGFVALLSALTVSAQTPSCLDVADEPHHQLLYSNADVRVFLLELPRLAATDPHCHSHSYFYVVTADSETSTTPEGHATFSHYWRAGETRFIYNPTKHVERNENANTFHEVIVETLKRVPYDPLDANYDSDEIVGDLGNVKPTWTASATRGALTVARVQLAPDAIYRPNGAGQVVIALTDLELKRDHDGLPRQKIELNAQDVQVLTGETAKLTNTGTNSAKFIIVEF
jgi:hypothetical protein